MALPWLLSAGIFLLPFLWLGDRASLGGDDTRLYFVYPYEWLTRFALPAFTGLNGLGNYSSELHFVPLAAFLAAVGFVLPWLNLEALAFGIALSAGFAGVYATSMLLMGELRAPFREGASALAGLLYVSAPLIATMYWVGPLSWVIGLGGAPALAALSLGYVKHGRLRYLFLVAVVGPLSAIGTSALPFSVPYLMGGAFALVIVLVLGVSEPLRVLRRVLLLGLVLLGSNAFWIIPLWRSVVTPGSFGAVALGHSRASIEHNVRAVAAGQSILDTLLLRPSGEFLRYWNWSSYSLWGWWRALTPLSFALPAVLVMAVVVVRTQTRQLVTIFAALSFATLVLAYLQTVNVSLGGVEAFVTLATRIPGFGMFRNFFHKFAGGYVFYYSVTFALALSIIMVWVRPAWRVRALGALAVVVALQGVPMLLGMSLHLPFGAAVPYGDEGKFPPSYLAALSRVAEKNPVARVLELPLSANYWSVLPLEPSGAIYVGSSPMKVLTGLETFNSIESFDLDGLPELPDYLAIALDQGDYETVGAILRLAGIRYIVHTEGLPLDAAAQYLRSPRFPSDIRHMREVAGLLGAVELARFGYGETHATTVYELSERAVLPRLFLAERVGMSGSFEELIAGMVPAGFPASSGTGSMGCQSMRVGSLEFADRNDGMLCAQSPSPGISALSRPYPWLYSAEVTTGGPAILVLMEPYAAEWTARAEMQGSSVQTANLPKIAINGYASGWLIPKDGVYSIELYYGPQTLSWIAAGIAAATVLGVGIGVLVKRRHRKLFRNTTWNP